jgi:protein-L-isoaspartate(D-aspartate) O-methyltransferase
MAFGVCRGFSAVIRAVACLVLLAICSAAIMVFWPQERNKSTEKPLPPPADEDRFAKARQDMVKWDLADRDITDPAVLAVMGRIAREKFVPPDLQSKAYEDYPLPIGLGQTISQPYIVALMTQLARPTPRCRALEVGVGSGYQAAVLAELCGEVYGIEILPELAASAAERLKSLGYHNVHVRQGDGYQGWMEHAPFDIIIVTAAPDHVPQPLVKQLAVGGRLVIPVGRYLQELLLLEKQSDGGLRRTAVAPVQFVPMTGRAEEGQ